MSGLSRRRALAQGAFVVAGAALARAGLVRAAEPRVIEMTARRFAYEPAEIPLKVGERVVVQIRSIDFVHGMNLPDLGKRLDLMPGLITPLELQPTQPGTIDFLCDNFCGEGHEHMQGRFIVSA